METRHDRDGKAERHRETAEVTTFKRVSAFIHTDYLIALL